MTTKTYRGIPITLDEKTEKWKFDVNRKRFTAKSLKQARVTIDYEHDEALQHNGANSNLYCDGDSFFVTGCPACDEAYKKKLKPRWARGKELANELTAAGLSELNYHADLWKIWAEGLLNGRKVRVEEV